MGKQVGKAKRIFLAKVLLAPRQLLGGARATAGILAEYCEAHNEAVRQGREGLSSVDGQQVESGTCDWR